MARRSRSRVRGIAGAVAVVLAAGCDSGRGTPLPEYPGAETSSPELVVGTVSAAGQPYVEALAANFVDGGRLVARLDERAAACVAERWIAVLDPGRLAAGGLAAEAMTNVTLERLTAAVAIDPPRAEALVGAYDDCEVDHTGAFLDSLLLTNQITNLQRVCLLEAMPADLVGAITVSVLVEPEVEPGLAAQYQEALDACPP